jgi:hypothetical protein
VSHSDRSWTTKSLFSLCCHRAARCDQDRLAVWRGADVSDGVDCIREHRVLPGGPVVSVTLGDFLGDNSRPIATTASYVAETLVKKHQVKPRPRSPPTLGIRLRVRCSAV